MASARDVAELARLRGELGLPPVGRLTRDQTRTLLAALDAESAPISDAAWTWARDALGVAPARTA